MQIEISGLGMIMYSPANVSRITEGADYLSTSYSSPSDVLSHVYAGDLVAFATSSPGTYTLSFHAGYPAEHELQRREFKLRLGIDVRDGTLVVRDLYDLMEWHNEYNKSHSLSLPIGFYHVTLIGNTPDSGILGDNQYIDVYLNRLDRMPELRFEGVPTFCS